MGRTNPSNSEIGKCAYNNRSFLWNRWSEAWTKKSKLYTGDLYKDHTIKQDIDSNDKMSRWLGHFTYKMERGFFDNDVIQSNICAGLKDNETPEQYKACLKRHSTGCHNKFVQYKKKTIAAAAKAKAAFGDWKSLSDPNYIQNLKDNRIRDSITNEKMKMNSILSGSWSDYQNLLKLYTMQSNTLDGKFKYYKYQQDILNSYQKKLEDTISDLNLNKQSETFKYNAKVKYQRQLILSRFLIIAVLITLILLVIRKWGAI